MKFVFSSLVFATSIAIILSMFPVNISISQSSDTMEIKSSLKKGDFIETNLYFQNANLTFGLGNKICPENNCSYQFEKTSFDDSIFGTNSKHLSGTLKIEDKENSEGDFISYSYYKLSGSFDLVNSKENPKTGDKILIYKGDLDLDSQNKEDTSGSIELEYQTQIKLYQPQNYLEVNGEIN